MKNNMNIGIIGQGFVGNAIYQKFKLYFDVYTYDLKPSLSNSNIDFIKKKCQIIFICLPTPMDKDGNCNISLVEETVSILNEVKAIVVIKSTVVPGTTEEFN